MKTTELNILHEKAEKRKDGVYSFKGYYWVVENKTFIAFADPNGKFYGRFGAFNVRIGTIASGRIKKYLTQWLKTKD